MLPERRFRVDLGKGLCVCTEIDNAQISGSYGAPPYGLGTTQAQMDSRVNILQRDFLRAMLCSKELLPMRG